MTKDEILFAIQEVVAHAGGEWPDVPGEPEVLRRVKAIARMAATAALRARGAVPDADLVADLKNAINTATELRQQLTLMEEHARGEVWRWQNDGADHLETMGNRMGVLIYAGDLRNLLAAAPMSARGAVPSGWKLVPVEPTDEMLKAPPNAWEADAKITWSSMLAVAPAAPGSGVEQDAAGRPSESRVLYGDEPITEQSFTPIKARDDKRCQACIDRRDGFYGSYAPACPVHDDDGNLRAAKGAA